MLLKLLLTTGVLVTSALASQIAQVKVAVESRTSSGSLQNTTISVPVNGLYKDSTVLQDISALYVIGSTGTPLDSISCQGFSTTGGDGKHTTSFTRRAPVHVSSSEGNDINSIVCLSMSISNGPPLSEPSSTSAGAGMASKSSTTLVTHTPRPHQHASHTTGSAAHTTNAGSSPTAASASASPSASQSAGNAASAVYLSGEFFGGLALAGFGVAFAL